MRQRLNKLVIGSVLAGALVLTGTARLSGAGGQVWRVPADFLTIQAAVDAASEGDTILVAPGVYVESVVVSKNVVLDGMGLGGLGTGTAVRSVRQLGRQEWRKHLG
jgi:hypothetical protein